MKTVINKLSPVICLFSVLILAIGFMANSALAWTGSCHAWASEAALKLFGGGENLPPPDPMSIKRNSEAPLFPELDLTTLWYDPEKTFCIDDLDDATWCFMNGFETREECCQQFMKPFKNWQWVIAASISKDGQDDTTLHHFWDSEEGLYGSTWNADNAWMAVRVHWLKALVYWQQENLGGAYVHLGYAAHMLQDMTQPAHANEDIHPGDFPIGMWVPGDDALEDWLSEFDDYCKTTFHWITDQTPIQGGGAFVYGPVLSVPTDNSELLLDMINPQSSWEGSADIWDDEILSNPSSPFNLQPLFYMMYVSQQTGNYFASDDEDGNSDDPIGWLNGFPHEFSNIRLLNADTGEDVSAHNSAGLYGLLDNDGCDCNDDGDLEKIAKWTYGAAFRAMPAFINFFRRTVDNVPPYTIYKLSRSDYETAKLAPECNNSNVTVILDYAHDLNRGGWRESGVWKVWGRCNGEPPLFGADQKPYWNLTEDGTYEVELLSTDKIGNVEGDENDFSIIIDQTPPVIEFPDLRPNYLTSETLTIKWTASDSGPCGMASQIAYLDEIQKEYGQSIDLSELAGRHKLEVYVTDGAGNMAYEIFEFEVWIDAEGWCFSVIVNNKTDGNAMTCSIQFPAPYDVGLISLSTSSLAVKGSIDLDEDYPIVEQTATLPAQLLTGVGDNNMDGIPDRKILFRKDLFVKALGGQTGNIQSIVSGGLLPDGQPRFLAEVTVPVFKSLKK
jgi:hypothetical protein